MNNNFNNDKDKEYEVYSKSYTPGDDGYTEENATYLRNGGVNSSVSLKKRIGIVSLLVSVGLLICTALVFITAQTVSDKYEKILDKKLEASIENNEHDAGVGENLRPQIDDIKDDWFYGFKEDVGMTISGRTEKDANFGKIGDDNLSMADVVELVSSSVVEITTSAALRNGLVYSEGAGSGVIVNENGIIVTNNHVVEGVTDISVRLSNGNVYEATIVATDPQTDLAVIKITPNEVLTVAVCGNSETIRVGEEVLAIGNPLGWLGGTVTNGIISALEREITIENETMTLLQHNAAVSPGNSGGALFNMRGELIGIVNAKYLRNGTEGLGFAIPINTVMSVYDDLVEYGYVKGRADHGLSIIQQYTLRPGSYGYVLYIVESKYSSELVYGDRLVAIDGVVPATADEAYALLGKYAIGDTIQITVYRSGSEIIIPLVVAEYQP